jgi:hypothetical protein
VAARHGLVTFEVLGRLIRMQAACAFGDFTAAGAHAEAADRLATDYELPAVAIFTGLFRALRSGDAGEDAFARLATGGMPGVEDGLRGLAALARGDSAAGPLGPYEPWARPWLLLREGRTAEAAQALAEAPESPHDLLLEARLALLARAAVALGDRAACARLHEALLPAAGQLAGAGSGVLSFGPVDDLLAQLAPRRRR